MTPISDDMVERIKAILSCKRRVNIPHPACKGLRIVGWIVDEEVAGLSDGLFAVEEIERRAAALEGSVAVPAWQPIETAPKDREILAVRIEWWEPVNGNCRWIHGNIRQTKWDADRQRFGFDHERQPTHWTDVPAIPALPIPAMTRQERLPTTKAGE